MEENEVKTAIFSDSVLGTISGLKSIYKVVSELGSEIQLPENDASNPQYKGNVVGAGTYRTLDVKSGKYLITECAVAIKSKDSTVTLSALCPTNLFIGQAVSVIITGKDYTKADGSIRRYKSAKIT